MYINIYISTVYIHMHIYIYTYVLHDKFSFFRWYLPVRLAWCLGPGVGCPAWCGCWARTAWWAAPSWTAATRSTQRRNHLGNHQNIGIQPLWFIGMWGFQTTRFGDSEIVIWGSLNAINKYHLGIPFSHGNIRDGLVVGFNTLCF